MPGCVSLYSRACLNADASERDNDATSRAKARLARINSRNELLS